MIDDETFYEERRSDQPTFETNWLGYACATGCVALIGLAIFLHYLYLPQPIVFEPVIVVREPARAIHETIYVPSAVVSTPVCGYSAGGQGVCAMTSSTSTTALCTNYDARNH